MDYASHYVQTEIQRKRNKDKHKRKSILKPSLKISTEILKSIHTKGNNKVTNHHLFPKIKQAFDLKKKTVELSITGINNSYMLYVSNESRITIRWLVDTGKW